MESERSNWRLITEDLRARKDSSRGGDEEKTKQQREKKASESKKNSRKSCKNKNNPYKGGKKRPFRDENQRRTYWDLVEQSSIAA